jgi:hypothetical protein
MVHLLRHYLYCERIACFTTYARQSGGLGGQLARLKWRSLFSGLTSFPTGRRQWGCSESQVLPRCPLHLPCRCGPPTSASSIRGFSTPPAEIIELPHPTSHSSFQLNLAVTAKDAQPRQSAANNTPIAKHNALIVITTKWLTLATTLARSPNPSISSGSYSTRWFS